MHVKAAASELKLLHLLVPDYTGTDGVNAKALPLSIPEKKKLYSYVVDIVHPHIRRTGTRFERGISSPMKRFTPQSILRTSYFVLRI